MALLKGACHAQGRDSMEITARILNSLLKLGPSRVDVPGFEDLEDAAYLGDGNHGDTFSQTITGVIGRFA
jgi:hypothetical protein